MRIETPGWGVTWCPGDGAVARVGFQWIPWSNARVTEDPATAQEPGRAEAQATMIHQKYPLSMSSFHSYLEEPITEKAYAEFGPIPLCENIGPRIK